ncbi:MAG: response regulator [Phycisphaeraceae bacterium]|nr:response regulator [Phycisphaeraceae bacterium]
MTPQTILLADDEAHITHVVGMKLRAAGYATVVARDGEEALTLALQHRPNLVITDLQMPYMSGIELATRLRSDERTCETPVLMLTARGYVLDQNELSATNIRAVLSKPFSARDILRRVEEVLGPAGASDSSNLRKVA